MLARNVIGFCLLGVAWLASKRVSGSLERGMRTLLPKQPVAPVLVRNVATFGALGATISLGAPLVLKRMGI